jgi:hypothetical protein
MTTISGATAAQGTSAPASGASPSPEAIANFQAALARFAASESSSGTAQPVTIKPQVLVGPAAPTPPGDLNNTPTDADSLVSNGALAKAESLSQNWDAWGMHNGVDFNHPPASLPQDAQDTLHYFASNPTLFSAIVQDAGGQPGGPMTLAELNQYILDAKGDASLARSLVPAGTPNSPIISNVQELVANWHTWGLHSVTQLSNPPSNLPPDAKAVLSFINSNPAVLAAIGNGTGSGVITEQNVANFLKKASSDATGGAKAYSDWAAANPNAGPESQALAQSAATILANMTLITGGSGNLTSSELAAFASSNNPNLNADVKGAAALWSQPGMFKMLDQAGDDLATTSPDQIATSANLSAWISKGAPTSDVDFANMLNQAALESTVAGIDTSKLGADVFANPQNYSGAQKAAVMVQLGDLQTKLAVGGLEGDWNAGSSELAETGAGINPNLDKVQADIQQRIDQLSQDPDVQAYIAQTKPSALQGIVNSDPALHDAIQSYYNGAFQNGDALTNDLNQKDSNGDQVSPTVGLQTFVQQASFYDEALGSGGKSLGIMDPQTGADGQPGPSKLQEIVKNSGHETLLQQTYMDQVVNGGLIKDAMANGADLSTAIGQYAAAAAAYGTALDPTFLQQNAGALRQNFLDNTSDAIMNSGSAADLAVAFGDQSGNFDVNKVTAILQQLQQQNPDLFKTSDGKVLTPDELVYTAQQAFDLTRNGLSLADALSKVTASVSAPTGSATDAYKAGTLHLLVALFGGGVLAAKAAEGAHTPLADASIAASAALVVGFLTEGTAKWAGSANETLWGAAKPPLLSDQHVPKEIGNDTVPDSAKKTIQIIQNEGKVLGSAGFALSGALGIVAGVGDLKAGDIAGAALDIGSGTATTLGGVAGAVEGGAALLGEAGLISSEFATIAVPASAAFGLVSSGVGVLGAVGYEIYGLVKAGENDAHFTDQVLPVLQQYGITGGPFEPGDVATPPLYKNPNIHI